MPKQKISAKELVGDIRSGVDDAELLEKYKLSSQGLHGIFKQLIAAGALQQAELDGRGISQQQTVDLPWKCPACGMPQAREFGECPACGIIVAKFLKQQEDKRKREIEEQRQEESKRQKQVIATYSVNYRGGHPKYPKKKAGGIDFLVFHDRFELHPTMGTRGWFSGLTIPYENVCNVEIAQRVVGTVEAMLGGLAARQLNQANNIHIRYEELGGPDLILRLEMLTGLSVMGQARKCREFEDLLQVHGIKKQFRLNPRELKVEKEVGADIPGQIERLAALRDKGILTQDEFETKKQELLSRL